MEIDKEEAKLILSLIEFAKGEDMANAGDYDLECRIIDCFPMLKSF